MYSEIVSFVRNYYNEPEAYIPLHEPRFIGNDRKYVLDAIDSTFVSSVGKYVDQFEEMVKDYTGAKYAVATVNGTAALHMSLLLAGVKANELVITQALSFIATCNAISYIGAEPVFVDIDAQNLGLSVPALQDFLSTECELKAGNCFHKKTGKRIAAVVPMHTFGHPVEIDKMLELCNQYHLPLVEDSAESMGSFYKGKHTGTFGQFGAFSFNGNKTITCGGGGVIVTNSEKEAKMAKHLTTQAKIPHRWNFEHDHIGYNYRMPNLNAALACAQIELLDSFLESKRKLAVQYAIFFKEQKVKFVEEPVFAKSNYWLNAVLFENKIKRDEFLTYSNDHQVMTRPAWQLMNKLEMFKASISGPLPVSELIADTLVNLPSSVLVKDVLTQ
jgi:aminotransferase in exopolysaccharide biosynthesis